MDVRIRHKVEFETNCPDCNSPWFNPGPRGGAAHNIRCAQCGSKFFFCPPLTPERIDSDDVCFVLELKFTTAQILSGEAARAVQRRRSHRRLS